MPTRLFACRSGVAVARSEPHTNGVYCHPSEVRDLPEVKVPATVRFKAPSVPQEGIGCGHTTSGLICVFMQSGARKTHPGALNLDVIQLGIDHRLRRQRHPSLGQDGSWTSSVLLGRWLPVSPGFSTGMRHHFRPGLTCHRLKKRMKMAPT